MNAISRLVALLFVGYLGTASMPLLAQPIISFEPSSVSLQIGQITPVDIVVSDVQNLFGYQFTVEFDPVILSAASVSEGSFLAGSLANPTLFVPGTIDNISGRISFISSTLVGAIEGVDGSGVLATIELFGRSIGTSPLSLSDVVLLDSTLSDISFTEAGARASVPEPTIWQLLGATFVGLTVVRISSQRLSTR